MNRTLARSRYAREALVEDYCFQRELNHARRLTIPALIRRRSEVRRIKRAWIHAIEERRAAFLADWPDYPADRLA